MCEIIDSVAVTNYIQNPTIRHMPGALDKPSVDMQFQPHYSV